MVVGYIYEILTVSGKYYQGELVSTYKNLLGVCIYSFRNYSDYFEVAANEICSYNCLGM